MAYMVTNYGNTPAPSLQEEEKIPDLLNVFVLGTIRRDPQERSTAV